MEELKIVKGKGALVNLIGSQANCVPFSWLTSALKDETI